jgi:hypothetical protein
MNRRSFIGSFFKAAIASAIIPSIVTEIEEMDSMFKTYFINGYTFKVMNNPIFDNPINTKNQFENHRIIFIDNE